MYGMAVSDDSASERTGTHAGQSMAPDARHMCRNCGRMPISDSGYSCIDCLGRLKVMSKVHQLLKDSDVRVSLEDVENRCRGLITGTCSLSEPALGAI